VLKNITSDEGMKALGKKKQSFDNGESVNVISRMRW
jgi:hypothetical protein